MQITINLPNQEPRYLIKNLPQISIVVSPASYYYGTNIQILQEYCTTEFLRLSGVYWGLTAMDLMGQLPRMNRSEVMGFIKACQHPTLGGFAPTLNHDPHLLYTLSAIQVCVCV